MFVVVLQQQEVKCCRVDIDSKGFQLCELNMMMSSVTEQDLHCRRGISGSLTSSVCIEVTESDVFLFTEDISVPEENS